MNIIRIIGIAVGLSAAAIAPEALARVFDTRADFVAATRPSHDVTFEGIAPDAGFTFVANPLVIGDLSIASAANAVIDRNFFIMPMDAFYVDALSGTATISFAEPVSAVGFALADQFNVFGEPITARIFNGGSLVGTETFHVSALESEDFNFSFFGVGGLGPITSIVLAPDPDVGGFLLVGEVLSGTAVPEPATWALMIAGFGLAGVALRRRPPTARPGDPSGWRGPRACRAGRWPP